MIRGMGIVKADDNAVEALPAPRRRAYTAVAAALLVAMAGGWYFFERFTEEKAPLARNSIFTSAYGERSAKYDTFEGAAPRRFRPCGAEPHDNCVVDGDTFWLNGYHIRIANIDAPDGDTDCAAGKAAARDATRTLSKLLDGKLIDIRGQGRDREGRLLALVSTREGDVGRNMVRWRVAKPWNGRAEPDNDWCAAG
ncbi:hypothetical protein E0D97_01450 [Oricola cellulosilytica]|uniref:TNase-like domain-containing protein n=2 Tax=Oricola cellulosilytica TaxID=1429082 RepID=A0A4V2MP38_9HYPH|nr:hypothetical protein E0D97_01450 [Oricola cellulosilytica]